MRWTDELFYILIFNCITGAIAYGLWILLKMNMARRKKLKYIYPMLGIVEAFFIFPIMYIYLKISTHVPGRHGMYYGTLFLPTPFIYHAQCVIAGIWIVGAVWNFAKYAFQYLIVIGWRQKKIIFPVREYEEKELTTILYHELVHIRQHILEMKKVGIFLKLIFWCNPMMNGLLRSIDMWGEIACDRYVCSETAYPYTAQEYYTVAVDGLEQSHLWMPKMVTGFRKKNNFKSRILQMKNYKKENDFKRIGGMTLVVFLCAVCTTTTFAAGEGFRAGYDRVFESTKVEIEEEVIEDTEYEEMFVPEQETIVSGELPDENPVEGNEEFQISTLESGTMFFAGTVYADRDQCIAICVNIMPAGQTVCYGIMTPDDKLWYVYAIDSGTHNFRISNSGNYKIFVKNVSTGDVDLEGGYVSY